MQAKSRRLAVTGASGFIGSRLVEVALDRGFEVIALCRNPASLPASGRQGLEVMAWQFGEALPGITGSDALCHLAAVIPGDFNDPNEAAACFETNALGALNLASQAADQGVGRFIYFSSGQVYAAGQRLASEDAPVYPASRATYYLTSKLAGELCVQALSRSKGIAVTVLRLASVYGAGMHGRGLLPNLIRRLSLGEPVTIQDGGSYSVDFVHVDDVVALTLDAIERGAVGVYNVGTGEARTSLEAAGIVADAVGAYRGLIAVEGSAAPHGFAALDIAKAKRELDFRPGRLEDGIAAWRKSGQLTNFSR